MTIGQLLAAGALFFSPLPRCKGLAAPPIARDVLSASDHGQTPAPRAGTSSFVGVEAAAARASAEQALQLTGDVFRWGPLSHPMIDPIPRGLFVRQRRSWRPSNSTDNAIPSFDFSKKDAQSSAVVMNAQKDPDVDVATPSVIGGVFFLLFVPILVLWGFYIKQGQPDSFRSLLLPLTLCALIVGTDAVNQSLSALMSAPMAITAVQAGALAVITGCWSLGCEVLDPVLMEREGVGRQLLKWGAVAVLFTVYQLVNHLVSYWCTLCERTVFANLCPAVTLFLEMTLMPSQIRPEAGFLKKASLATMLLGAVLFCIQYADFSRAGVAVSLLMVGLTIPYRIVQRWLLVECSSLTIGVMACYDGLLLTIPSGLAFSAHAGPRSWVKWGEWISTPSICLMLVLSLLTFSANHCVSLAMLRSGSATNYLVMYNVSNVLVVCMGIMFFHDNVISSPVMIVGISMSLLGGIAYALETSIAGSSRWREEAHKLERKA